MCKFESKINGRKITDYNISAPYFNEQNGTWEKYECEITITNNLYECYCKIPKIYIPLKEREKIQNGLIIGAAPVKIKIKSSNKYTTASLAENMIITHLHPQIICNYPGIYQYINNDSNYRETAKNCTKRFEEFKSELSKYDDNTDVFPITEVGLCTEITMYEELEDETRTIRFPVVSEGEIKSIKISSFKMAINELKKFNINCPSISTILECWQTDPVFNQEMIQQISEKLPIYLIPTKLFNPELRRIE